MAWGQVISWGGDETSDKWCASTASLLMGTLNGKLTGNDKAMYLNKLKGEFGWCFEAAWQPQLSGSSIFPTLQTQIWNWRLVCASLCLGLDLGNSREGAVLVPHLCPILHQAGISLTANFENNSQGAASNPVCSFAHQVVASGAASRAFVWSWNLAVLFHLHYFSLLIYWDITTFKDRDRLWSWRWLSWDTASHFSLLIFY